MGSHLVGPDDEISAHMLFQVPTLYVQPGMALKRLHVCAGSSKPLLLVYTHALRHLQIP